MDLDTLIFWDSVKTPVNPLLSEQPRTLDEIPSFPIGQNSGTYQEKSKLKISNSLRETRNLDEKSFESQIQPKMCERGREEQNEGNFINLESEQNKRTCQQNLDLGKLDGTENGQNLGVRGCTSGREPGRRADGDPREENLKCEDCETGGVQSKEDSEPRARTENKATREKTEDAKHSQIQGNTNVVSSEGGSTTTTTEVDTNEDTQKEDERAYWSIRAIRNWIQEWFIQHPMETWTIDNYDGHESYQELGFSSIEPHHAQEELDPDKYKQLRRSLTIIEDEMDEVLEDNGMTDYEKRREWHKLKDLVISVCNDYTPETLQAMKVGWSTTTTRSAYRSEEKSNNHDADTREVGRSHVDCTTDRERLNGEWSCYSSPWIGLACVVAAPLMTCLQCSCIQVF